MGQAASQVTAPAPSSGTDKQQSRTVTTPNTEADTQPGLHVTGSVSGTDTQPGSNAREAAAEEFTSIKSIAEMTADYVAYLAKQGKVYYETPDDARRAVEHIETDFTNVTKSKKKKSKSIPVEEPEPIPTKKDKRKKKHHTTTQESDTAYTSKGTVRKTRNRLAKEDLAQTLDKPEQLFKDKSSKSKGRIRRAQSEAGSQTEGPDSTYAADEDPDPGDDTPDASDGDANIPI